MTDEQYKDLMVVLGEIVHLLGHVGINTAGGVVAIKESKKAALRAAEVAHGAKYRAIKGMKTS